MMDMRFSRYLILESKGKEGRKFVPRCAMSLIIGSKLATETLMIYLSTMHGNNSRQSLRIQSPSEVQTVLPGFLIRVTARTTVTLHKLRHGGSLRARRQ